MMKRPGYILALCAVLMMIFPGCREDSGELELPGSLKVTAVLPEEYPAEVTSYSLSWYDPGEQAAVDTFMRGDSPERTEWAEGPCFNTDTGSFYEYMYVYTGVVKGGLSYGYFYTDKDIGARNDLINRLRVQQPWECLTGYLTPWEYGAGKMEEAGTEDLDFLPYDDALARIEDKMSACGFPEHELLRGESHTAGLLNKNRDIYNRAAKEAAKGGGSDKPFSETFTKDDEFYYFQFRQTLGGIPFCSAAWSRTTTSAGGTPHITGIYNKEGLVEFYAANLCEAVEPLSTQEIITPEEALRVYVEEYSKAIHFVNTDITDVELNYLIIEDDKGIYARPAWVITDVTEIKAGEGELPHDFDYTEYEYTAVSAFSGVILERETDMR